MQVAQTILNQLGGGKFLAMTGAKNLVSDGNTLRFKLPARFAKDNINHVSISLNSSDLYDMSFGTMAGPKKMFAITEKAARTGLYFDMIQAEFTDVTGLDTHL